MRWFHSPLLVMFACALSSCNTQKEVHELQMSDGATIYTEVHAPEGFPGSGPYPVILYRTPYSREGFQFEAAYWTDRGYVVVGQEIRATFGSPDPGVAIFEADGWGPKQDARETVEWILDQEWSSGEIGTVGLSAPAIASALAAGATQDITAQVIDLGCSQLYNQAVYWGGVGRIDLAGREWDVIGKWRANPLYNDFWAHHDTKERAPFITAPAIHIGGWFDIFSKGTLEGFQTRQENGGPGAAGNQKLIMGPWTHSAELGAGELTFPSSQLMQSPLATDRVSLRDQFMNFWLRNQGSLPNFTVLYYVMGDTTAPGAPGNEWRYADAWPPEEKAMRAYYLSAAGTNGLLTTAPPVANPLSVTYSFDPLNPVPTLGGNNLALPAGSFDQRAIGPRSDVLVFMSTPLSAPLEITGNVRAHLFVRSSATDTDFTAKLVDIYPDGRHMLVLDGIQRLRFGTANEASDYDTQTLNTPGSLREIVIDLWSTSLVLNEGHRIGLHISSSNSPRFEVNPNTGADNFDAANTVVAQNTIELGGPTLSRLYLPVTATEDVDGDGLDEAGEVEQQTDPLSSDTDRDGISDTAEIVAGTNPLLP